MIFRILAGDDDGTLATHDFLEACDWRARPENAVAEIIALDISTLDHATRVGLIEAALTRLHELRHALAVIPADCPGFHASRRDCSRRIADVFTEPALARQVQKVEGRCQRGEINDLRAALTRSMAMAAGHLPPAGGAAPRRAQRSPGA